MVRTNSMVLELGFQFY